MLTQSYNRYTYCLNNPLRYTDPCGYTFKPDDWNKASAPIPWHGGQRGSISNMFANADAYFGSFYSYDAANNVYRNGNYEVVGFDEVNKNYIEPNTANLPANTIINSIEIGAKGVWFQYGGNGPVYTNALTEPGAKNPYYETSGGEVIAKFIPWGNFGQSRGVDWRGVTNASILLAGGMAEMAIGGASEYFSAGFSSAVSIPLIVDGGVRTATNAQRLWQYLNGNTRLANAYPTSIGSLAGKGIDITFGVSPYSVGYGQAIGSWGNDLISFGATGGTGGALLEIQRTQNVDAFLYYLFTYLSYPYSQYHNKPSML